MHPGLINPAVVGYICAMGLALAYLVQRHELVHRLAVLSTLAGWAAHTVALIVRAVALGFPFLTVGLLLGALWARTSWGTALTFDPLAFFSLVAWVIYAGTLAGRAAAGWHGRRAAYFAIVGFAALVVTLGAGLFMPGRHGF